MAQVRLSAPGARVVIVLDAEAEPGPVRAAAVVRGRAITGVQVIPEDPALTNGVIINNPPQKSVPKGRRHKAGGIFEGGLKGNGRKK